MAKRITFLAILALAGEVSVSAQELTIVGASRTDLSALRAAVMDLIATFGDRYAGGAQFLAEIDHTERRLESQGRVEEELLRSLRRRALVGNPLVSAQPILFVERRQYPEDHHNTGNLFQTKEINTLKFRQMAGGSLKAVDLATGTVKTLLHCPDGTPRDPELRFDGQRIVFSMRRNIRDDYHVYEIDTDGGEPRQLTSARGVSDLDPFYLACGDIAFSSTREPKYCPCNRHIMANLFRMEADGANILQIGMSTEYEGHGTQLPDGRLLYFRWEYTDRNFGGAQGLWVANPDGTDHAIYYGQSTPHAILNARPIPGSDRVICIISSCHDRPWGALAILDRSLGIEGDRPVVRIWPESARRLIAGASQGYAGSGGFDNFKKVALKYEDPYPLSDRHFLVSRVIERGSEDVGIFLVDTFGNEVLVHRAEPGKGCYDPMPVAPHPRPRVLPRRRNYAREDGTFYVSDVYRGTHMRGVRPGSIKSLRVVENPAKLYWTQGSWGGQGQEAPAMNWHDFDNKRILGTVPVEADGSAYFAVPPDRFVYFQLLDEKGKMVQSMRSGVIVQSGETNACTGCHDSPGRAPAPRRRTSLALEREPSRLAGWYGEARDFSFMDEVQPVLTKNCVRCHDYGGEAGEVLNLAPDRTLVFNTAYMELHARGFVQVVGGGPNRILDAYSWGSKASRLVQVIEEGHHDVELSEEEYDRIVTWIDLNAPYYPTYASAYDRGVAGRGPLNDSELKELEKETGRRIRTSHGARPMVSFERPRLSPILVGLRERDPAAHARALSILRTGRERLREKPRADMPNFVACETDRKRKQKYDRLWSHQLRIRDAIRKGEKVYDQDLEEPPAEE